MTALDHVAPAPTSADALARTRSRRVVIAAPPGWPITVMFGLFPIWWALGLSQLIFLIMAVPMSVTLWRRRPIRLPPFFGLWALLLLWMCAGVTMLSVNPLGTVPNSFAGRMPAYLLRVVSYLTVTVLLLYIGNLTEKEMSRRRICGWLSWMFLVTVAGGIFGVLAPHAEFSSALELALPSDIRHNPYIQSLVHPASSQLQDVLGYAAPRPKAPFEYTNYWGNNLSITGIWFVTLAALGGVSKRPAVRWLLVSLTLMIAVVPAIWSLNRALWVGAMLSVFYVALRLALQRRIILTFGLIGASIAMAIAVPFTPLGTIISSRLDNGKSDQIRSNLSRQTVDLVNTSPVLGFGTTRTAQGSPESLAVGKSAECPRCGNFVIGSNGQFWQLMISTGYVGTGLYALFFGLLVWRYRHDRSAIGIAGSLVMCLVPFYGLFYNPLPSPMAFYFVSLALLWRNDQYNEEATA